MLFPTLGSVYVWRMPTKAYSPEYLFLTVKYEGGFVMVWAAISWYSVGPIITLDGQITAKEYVDRLGNQVQPMMQTFLKYGVVFQDDMPLFTQL
jgi:hypothetical protein